MGAARSRDRRRGAARGDETGHEETARETGRDDGAGEVENYLHMIGRIRSLAYPCPKLLLMRLRGSRR